MDSGVSLEGQRSMQAREKENGWPEAFIGSFMKVPAALAAGLSASKAMAGARNLAWSISKVHGPTFPQPGLMHGLWEAMGPHFP
jgi:hypothetical protein